MRTLLGLLLVGTLSYAVLHLLLPRLLSRLGRGLHNPMLALRWRQFQNSVLGYGAFIVLTTAFFASLFLELYVNDKPLYIRYQDHHRFPAVAEWVDTVLPFTDPPQPLLAWDFGLEAPGVLDGRSYARWVSEPSALQEEIDRLEKERVEDEERFRATLREEAAEKGQKHDPTAELPEWKIDQYEQTANYVQELRGLQEQLKAGAATVVMPLYPYSPTEPLLELPGTPPHRSFQPGLPLLGTDFEGKDVLSQLLYGFRISLAFALGVAAIGYAIGVMIGGLMGYFGGWLDILTQRVIEVWSSIPFLYTMMIIAAAVAPSFWVLALMLVVLQAWIGITYTVRGEFYRERSRDYVQAARALGLGHLRIMTRHILPNSLVPVVTFLPFSIVGNMTVLVSLDYLGFGLPPGTPSWGALLHQGTENIVNHPQLVFIPVIAFAGTLLCVVMIGEAVREAFDPKKHARLR
ncbi:MAG: ABC transporter permease subunit [Armatimonadetes bacterium]|nr:ABC transporter permease subunit [Armatimonadota bacterium]